MIQGQMGSSQTNPTLIKQQQKSFPKGDKSSLEKLAINQHKKRKNRRKNKQRKEKDPEQQKDVQLQRLRVKREEYWDSRFIRETIPDLFTANSIFVFTSAKRKKSEVTRVLHSPLQLKMAAMERVRFPQLPKSSAQKNTINIRNSLKVRNLPNETKSIDYSTKKRYSVSNRQDLTSQRGKELRNKKRLQGCLQQKANAYRVSEQYRNMLLDLIQRSINKQYKYVRQVLEKQINSIGSSYNHYTHLCKLVLQRRRMLEQIRQSKDDLKLHLEMQVHSLILIEQILKFKAFWETLYKEQFYLERKINFYFTNHVNYLTQMKRQVSGIAKGDPFLIAQTQKLRTKATVEQKVGKNELMLKIRACQLLLIEEQFRSK